MLRVQLGGVLTFFYDLIGSRNASGVLKCCAWQSVGVLRGNFCFKLNRKDKSCNHFKSTSRVR
jgi:hypothetical protein